MQVNQSFKFCSCQQISKSPKISHLVKSSLLLDRTLTRNLVFTKYNCKVFIVQARIHGVTTGCRCLGWQRGCCQEIQLPKWMLLLCGSPIILMLLLCSIPLILNTSSILNNMAILRRNNGNANMPILCHASKASTQ